MRTFSEYGLKKFVAIDRLVDKIVPLSIFSTCSTAVADVVVQPQKVFTNKHGIRFRGVRVYFFTMKSYPTNAILIL